MILLAASVDAGDHTAWVIVEGESEESWRYFFGQLVTAIPQVNHPSTITSGCDKGISAADDRVPRARRAYCVEHLSRNGQKNFGLPSQTAFNSQLRFALTALTSCQRSHLRLLNTFAMSTEVCGKNMDLRARSRQIRSGSCSHQIFGLSSSPIEEFSNHSNHRSLRVVDQYRGSVLSFRGKWYAVDHQERTLSCGRFQYIPCGHAVAYRCCLQGHLCGSHASGRFHRFTTYGQFPLSPTTLQKNPVGGHKRNALQQE